MKEYLYLRFKKISPLFLICIIVELVFLGLKICFPKNSSLRDVNDLWYIAASTILIFYTSLKIIKIYYIGEDKLINILPFSNELLILIEIVFYTFLTIVVGIVYHFVDFYNTKFTFEYHIYTMQKAISLLSFYLLVLVVCMLFKNISNPKSGQLLILLFTVCIVIMQISIFWSMNSKNIHNFLLGLSYPYEKPKFIYLNVIPFIFVGLSDNVTRSFASQSNLLNVLMIFIEVAVLIILKKTRKLNYLDLEG